MAKAKRQKAYFGLSWIISIILAILPTNVLLGIIVRVQRGKIIPAILNLVLAPLFYIVDLVTIILYKDLTFFA